MVLNVLVVESVAHASATMCQFIACNPERFSSDRVLFLVFCFPFQSLRRLGLSVRSSRFFCCFPSLDSSASDAGSSHNGAELAAVKKKVNGFLNYGKQNKESLGFLFATLMIKVEDFTDRSQNVSRAVGKQEIQRINNLISHSICTLVSFLEGTLHVPQLKHLLFDPKSSPQAIKDEAACLAGTRTVVPYSLPNIPSRQAKKRRWNDITGGKQAMDPRKAQEEQMNLRSDPWEERKSQVDQHRRDAWNGWGGNNELKKYWCLGKIR